MSVRVSYKQQIAFFILCIFIIFGILEGFAKIWWSFVETCAFEDSDVYQDISPPMRKQMCVESYQTRFSSAGMEANQDFETIKINSFGFRGKEISMDKPQNVYRIFTVGGSTMLGTGSTSDVTTIAGFLQSKFDNTNLDVEVEVINAGVSGAWSQTETNYIKTKLVHFEPDLFIIYDGWNDASNSLNIDENGSYSVKTWIDRWKEICNLGKEMNFDTIVTIQPIVGTGNKILTAQEFKFYNDPTLKKLLDRLELFAQSLDDLEFTCSKTADLRTAFDGLEIPIYWDAGHMGNAGNEIIASKMFEISFPFVSKKDISEISNIAEDKTIEIKNESSQYQKDILVMFKRTFLYHIKSPLMVKYFFTDSEKDIITHLPNRINIEYNKVNIDFSFQDLSNQNISGDYLFKKDLSNKILFGTNFASSYLREATFMKSDLTNANLSGTNLVGADFSHANLTNADLRKANLGNAIFKDAILRGAQLDGAIMYNTNLRGADMSGVDLTNTNLRSVDFQGADMRYVNLSGHDLRRMFFIESDLSFADLRGTFIDPTFIKEATLKGANLSGSTLASPPDFSNMDLTDTNFSFAFVFGGNFSNSNLERTNFVGANIEFANFENSNLESSFGSPFIGCNNHPLCIQKN